MTSSSGRSAGGRRAVDRRTVDRRTVGLGAAPGPLAAGTALVALLVALPVLAVVMQVLQPSGEVWSHLAATVLPRYLRNTLWLMLGVGGGVLVIGVGTAWLSAMCRFPGRRIWEWALLLPLAVPTYVIAYAYTDFLQYSGPLQSALRDAFGWSRSDYWFPEIRSVGGAIAVMSLVLYPYVYLLARAAFLEQSVGALEVGRTLGRGPWRLFGSVALPLARPAIAGGTALALMETLNDFGAVQHFGVDTFTTGIYRTWFGLGEPVAAAQLASLLLLFVIALVLLERGSRGEARFFSSAARYRPLPRYELSGWRAGLAFVACATPVALGFLLPAGLLAQMAVTDGDPLLGRHFLGLAGNSFTLAAVAGALAVALALLVGYGLRSARGRLTRGAARIAALGYAVPGSVIAVGVLQPLGWLDQHLHAAFGTGLLLTGSVAALIYAYLVRFLAVSLNAVEASLEKITPSMDGAARTLGLGPGRILARVHLPLTRSSLLAAGILVFVDVMKELPATVILRPFDFDTLAVRAYELASDERLSQASTAALAIVVVGIVPVIMLSRAMSRARPGQAVDSDAGNTNTWAESSSSSTP